LFTRIVENLGHAIYVRQDNKFIWINSSFAELFGYQKEEILEMSLYDLIHPDCFEYMEELVSKFQTKEHKHLSFEVKGVKKDGTIFVISVVTSIVILKGK
jgi:PAS domain S-box-containing protein